MGPSVSLSCVPSAKLGASRARGASRPPMPPERRMGPSVSLRCVLPARPGSSRARGASRGSCPGSRSLPALPAVPTWPVHLSVCLQDTPSCRRGEGRGLQHSPSPGTSRVSPQGRGHPTLSTSGVALTSCGSTPLGSCVYLCACVGRIPWHSLFHPFPASRPPQGPLPCAPCPWT